jgi:PAS domain S-box-containing protein
MSPTTTALVGSVLTERQYQALFDSLSTRLIVLDPRGHLVQANQAALARLELQDEDNLGCSLWEMTWCRDCPEAQTVIRRAVQVAAGGESFRGEVHIQDADGAPITLGITLRPLLGPGGTVERLVGEFSDATTETVHDTAATESELRFRTMLANAPAVIFALDRDGVFELSEGLLLSKLGLKPGEVVGRSAFELYRDIPSIVESIQRALAGEATRIQNVIGQITFDTVYAPYRNSAGELAGAVGIARDVTDLVLANEESESLRTQLIQAQRMEAIGQLAGGVAHDFNNILAAMLMNLSLMRGDPELSPDHRSMLRDLEDGANRAANLTRQLLSFSRRQVMQRELLDLDSLIGNLLRMLRRLIGENITLECPGSGRSIWINVDPGMIEQVIMNLVVNSRDAMPSGGRLLIRTDTVKVADLSGLTSPHARKGEFATMTIFDNGSGMSEETLKHAFEPFFTTKDVGKGTGLGLATVFNIVKRHQGWVEFDSQVGVGTSARVYLPLHIGGAIAKPQPEVHPEVTAPGHEIILLAEDDPLVRSMADRVLRKAGYRVAQAQNGQQALELWASHRGKIDLLLTDMIMPEGLTGLDLAQRLRRQKPALKVIIMSGYVSPESGKGIAADDRILYLSKPFETAALTNLVRRHLDDEIAGTQFVPGLGKTI